MIKGGRKLIRRVKGLLKDEKGMEMVQVAILIAIAIGMGILFKGKIGDFITGVFNDLVGSDFSDM